MISKKNRMHIFYILVVISLLMVNFKLQKILNIKSDNNIKSYNKKSVILSDTTIQFQNSFQNYSLVGFIKKGDCGTCSEVMINRLNKLNQNIKWQNKISLEILSKNNTDFEFRDYIINNYHPSFPIRIRDGQDENLFWNILKTPYIVKFDNTGKIVEITQIEVNKLRKALRYFDKLK